MKTIILCADGTWNGFSHDHDKDGAPDYTNVLKLFLYLQGENAPGDCAEDKEQERILRDEHGNVVQIAKYLHGVGDSAHMLDKMIGGAFGAGLIARIVRGYTFVSRNYEPGDRIVLLGFSRGAYTVRALGGLIASQGLLDAEKIDMEDRAHAYLCGAAAWFKHRHASLLAAKPGLLTTLESLVEAVPQFFARRLHDQDLRPVESIEAIAVWDTVGSMGVPVFVDQHHRVDLYRFADTALDPKVRHAFHAVAIDERRADFEPTLWETDDERIEQVLFPGAHADVGGGYPSKDAESGLSDGALEWMKQSLCGIGVLFNPSNGIAFARDHAGPAHEPWTQGLFSMLPNAERQLPANLMVHESVAKRWQTASVPIQSGTHAPYRPSNLAAYLDADGKPLPGVRVVPR